MFSSEFRRLRQALLAAYILAAVLLPLFHHDVLCHLQSSTHCTSCAVASWGEAAGDSRPPGALHLSDTGRAVHASAASRRGAFLRASSARSPPARG
jgi:hypothetical protein